MRHSLLLGLLAAVLALENHSVPVAGATTVQRRLGEAQQSSGGESTSSSSSSAAEESVQEEAAAEERVEEAEESYEEERVEEAEEERVEESSSSSSSSEEHESSSSSSSSEESSSSSSASSSSESSDDSSDEYTDSCVEAWDEADSESFMTGVKYVWCELILQWYVGLGVLFFLLCCLGGEESPLPHPHPSYPPPHPLPPTPSHSPAHHAAHMRHHPSFLPHRLFRYLLVVLLLQLGLDVLQQEEEAQCVSQPTHSYPSHAFRLLTPRALFRCSPQSAWRRRGLGKRSGAESEQPLATRASIERGGGTHFRGAWTVQKDI